MRGFPHERPSGPPGHCKMSQLYGSLSRWAWDMALAPARSGLWPGRVNRDKWARWGVGGPPFDPDAHAYQREFQHGEM